MKNKTKTIDLKFYEQNIFAFYSVNGFCWFRVFGFGLHLKNTQKHKLTFSERNGYKKGLNIGKYRISIL